MFTKINETLREEITPGGSRARLIHAAFSKHEITRPDADRHMALLISETLGEHRPKTYPMPSDVLMKYVNHRFSEIERREQVMAAKNGEWIQIIVRLRYVNVGDYELLVWAGQILKALSVSAEKLSLMRRAASEHINQHKAFNWNYFSTALQVQEMDSDERRRGNS